MEQIHRIAVEARELAIQVRQELLVRYDVVDKSIAELKGMLKWVGGVIISLILAVLGWSLAQQYQANEAQKSQLLDQIHTLQAASAAAPQAPPTLVAPAAPRTVR